MKIANIIIGTLLIFAVMNACKSSKPSEKSDAWINREISMKKSPCFGDCPVYEITIKASGEVVYKGEYNVDKVGYYSKTLSQESLEEIWQLFDDADFFNLEDKYDNELVTDLPSTMLTVKWEDGQKQIENRIGGPKSLLTISRKLQQIAFSESGWTKISKPKDE